MTHIVDNVEHYVVILRFQNVVFSFNIKVEDKRERIKRVYSGCVSLDGHNNLRSAGKSELVLYLTLVLGDSLTVDSDISVYKTIESEGIVSLWQTDCLHDVTHTDAARDTGALEHRLLHSGRNPSVVGQIPYHVLAQLDIRQGRECGQTGHRKRNENLFLHTEIVLSCYISISF